MNRFENLSLISLGSKCMKFAILCPLILASVLGSCAERVPETDSESETQAETEQPILPGIYKVDSLSQTLLGKNVAVVSNHTGMIGDTHLVDTLLSLGINVKCVMSPEHGFRGDTPDGDNIKDSIDDETGLPIFSVYGKTKKPTPEMLKGVDIILFDIQDVGARFYTYLSTLHYVMEAAAELGLEVIVLDRPNPNGFYIDGPILEKSFESFVGLHPVPVVYGMTIGEYALMINGEKWLDKGQSCDLFVVKCSGYTHASLYQLPIKPSPNLPDMESIYLYPTICFFEGTTVSVGRGTDTPFSIIGEPSNTKGDYYFTPEAKPGASTNPKHKGEKCRGYNLRREDVLALAKPEIQVEWYCKMYSETTNQKEFFNANLYFDKLAGNDSFRKAILAGESCEAIHESWQPGIEAFKKTRAKYLIYP
jgi:uncharacterized protein YbbC (DUF1343 family)